MLYLLSSFSSVVMSDPLASDAPSTLDVSILKDIAVKSLVDSLNSVRTHSLLACACTLSVPSTWNRSTVLRR